MFDLTGKSALVTGASGGIGGAIARALHARGATVAISGTRRDALDALAGELAGRVLSGLIKRIAEGASATPVGTPDDVAAFKTARA